jgi:predicted nucleic acid-binding protein
MLYLDLNVLALALNLIRKYQLDPRDAIHAAIALTAKAKTVVSTDAHFDRIKELKRKPL